MTVGPLCLCGPQPEFRVREGQKPLRPSLAGYVLRPHSDYEIEVTASGLPITDWKVHHVRKPSFVNSVTVTPDGADAYIITIATQRAVSGLWSWLTEFGDDLPLTITYDDESHAAQQVNIPLVPGRPWTSAALFALSMITTIAWWIVVESPKSAPDWLPADWSSRLTIALSCVVALTFAFVVYRWFVQPWLRHMVLRRQAQELIV